MSSAPPSAQPSPPDRRGLYKAFAASLSGTSLEWYDFAVYSSAAALVFGDLFFPGSDPLTGTLQAFATYAVGYVARPLGGIFFGRLGDVIGRKRVLVATLLLIGVATFCIGLLPTHAQAGAVAPTLLVVLRFAQGVGVGGEWGGAVLLSSEFSEAGQRGFWASAAQVGPPLGTLLANGVLAVLAGGLSEDAFLSWGWRVAFLLSAVLVAFGLLIRSRLEETPVFRELEARGDRPTAPVSEVLRTQTRPLIAAILARVGPDVLYAMFAVFVLTYATKELGMSRGEAVTAVLVGSALQVVMIPWSGWLSDRYGRRTVYAIGAVGGAVWSVVFFAMASSLATVLPGVVIGLVFHSLMYGPQAAFVSEQFTARLRYTGSSLAYTFAGVIGGALAPLAFTYFLAKAGTGYVIAAYIIVACSITLVGLRLGRAVQEESLALSPA
ncbi:MFS transporter [Kribbella soli]|uniref:MFS transporter n=1 Tax=Kribbella soli TaxID=1124743 RepID=A0A4R0H4G4_9ACTN|nr:MFS transporter [Kribbella soli]TCC05655.1 MFS transporter [Kribbella soli]